MGLNLKINSEYAAIADELSLIEYQDLKESIKQNDLLDSIKINEEGEILDGHHRYPICQELGIEPRTTKMHFENKYLEKLFVIKINAARRQLNEFGRIKLALKAKPIYEEMAKRNMSLGGKGVPVGTPLGRIDQKIAKVAHSSKNKVRQVEYLLENAKPEDLDRLKQGGKIHKTYNFVKKEATKKARLQMALNTPLQNGNGNGTYDLIHGDMRDFIDQNSRIPDNSVQLIVTDPPYDGSSLPLYGDLGKFAQRKLKPGGCLAVISPQYAHTKVGNFIENNSNLNPHWDIVIVHSGSTRIIREMQVLHKTMLMYYKGDKPVIYGPMPDLIRSIPPDKTSDKWAQSPEDARHIVRYLTLPGEIVVDCFMAEGTFGIAAIEEGRRFIGIEKSMDKSSIASATIDNAYGRLLEKRQKGIS